MIIWKRIEVVITGLATSRGFESHRFRQSEAPARKSRPGLLVSIRLQKGKCGLREPPESIPEHAVRNSQQEVWKRQSRFSPWETAFENAAQKMHEQVEQIPYLRRKDNANTGMDRKR